MKYYFYSGYEAARGLHSVLRVVNGCTESEDGLFSLPKTQSKSTYVLVTHFQEISKDQYDHIMNNWKETTSTLLRTDALVLNGQM